MRLDPKAPAESKLYVIDLTPELRTGDDFLTGFTLERTGGTVTLSDQAYYPKGVSAVFVGGAAAEEAAFTLTATTSGGQTLTRQITVPVLALGDAPYTSSQKGALVAYAYEEATLAGYEFDVTPEEKTTALRRLDALMAEWRISSLDVGYNAPTTIGGSAMTDVSGVPDVAFQAVGLELALRLFPTLGKTMSPESRVAHARSMSAVRTWCLRIPERRMPGGVPLGQGSRWGRRLSPFSASPRPYAQQASATSGGADTANISDMVAIFNDHADD